MFSLIWWICLGIKKRSSHEISLADSQKDTILFFLVCDGNKECLPQLAIVLPVFCLSTSPTIQHLRPRICLLRIFSNSSKSGRNLKAKCKIFESFGFPWGTCYIPTWCIFHIRWDAKNISGCHVLQGNCKVWSCWFGKKLVVRSLKKLGGCFWFP